MNAARFEHWPWRDFGHFGMTQRQAGLEAAFAEQMAEKAGLPGSSAPTPASEWAPWGSVREAFAAAEVS